jgi:hypothetical protein
LVSIRNLRQLVPVNTTDIVDRLGGKSTFTESVMTPLGNRDIEIGHVVFNFN